MQPLTIEELERWVDFGAKWRAISVTDELAIVDMCQCTGDLVERRKTASADVIAYLRTHDGDSE